MPFSQEQKSFMLESYFRNGHKTDGVFQYNIPNCLEEFQNELPGVIFQSILNYIIP
ncbi:hypothetical protein BDFB_015106 [Asbolus verrucosus]|nr:hypothetical protein BDFB_015106 [Asbolus verrucosus]